MEDSEAVTREALARDMLARALADPRQEFGSFFLSRFLGLDIGYDGERCIVGFDAVPPLYNPQGTLHGGILATAMDISMGHLLRHVAGAGTTLEMKVQYLAPLRAGRVTCTGSFLRRGRRVCFLQSEARDEDAALAAYATATWQLLRAEPEPGSSPP